VYIYINGKQGRSMSSFKMRYGNIMGEDDKEIFRIMIKVAEPICVG